MAERLVVKVTCGEDDRERANQAFTVASSAVASGVETSLWLTGEAAWLAVPGYAEEFTLIRATPLVDLLEIVLDLGSMTLCTQCALRRGITDRDVRDGIRIAGAAAFVEEVLRDGTQALVY